MKVKFENGPRNVVVEGSAQAVRRLKNILDLHAIETALFSTDKLQQQLQHLPLNTTAAAAGSTVAAGEVNAASVNNPTKSLGSLVSLERFLFVSVPLLVVFVVLRMWWVTEEEEEVKFKFFRFFRFEDVAVAGEEMLGSVTGLLLSVWVVVCAAAFLKLVFYYFFSPLPSPASAEAASRYH